MGFDVEIFYRIKDHSTKDLKKMLGSALLKSEHGFFKLHEEHGFKEIPGQEKDFVYQEEVDDEGHHILFDPFSGKNLDSDYEEQIPSIDGCLDDQCVLERAEAFVSDLNFFEMSDLYENLKSKDLLSECVSGIVLTKAIYNFLEKEIPKDLPLVALSIILGRSLIKRRF
ncbi:MAG: hypothetical protein ACEPOW_09675 [Bacteroidales bacterium]